MGSTLALPGTIEGRFTASFDGQDTTYSLVSNAEPLTIDFDTGQQIDTFDYIEDGIRLIGVLALRSLMLIRLIVIWKCRLPGAIQILKRLGLFHLIS